MAQRQTFSLNFYCRASKADKRGYAPVELSIVINNERTYIKLQRKEKPEVFKNNLASKRDNETKVFRDNQIVRINAIVEEMSFAGVELNAQNLKACIRKGGVVKSYTLGQLWSDIIVNKQCDLRTGEISNDTYRRYGVAKAAFYKANGFTDDTPAKVVELQNINNLQHYLREDRKVSQGSVYNYHARCKAAFTLAFNRGKIPANPYSSFKMDKGERKEKVFLDKSEIAKITSKHLEGRMARVRDLFLFQCYSGLAYSDMASITPEDCTNREGDLILIQKPRKKTGVIYKSMVFGEGVRILERYNFNLPVLSNAKYNSYLKELQDICGIGKTLHTHLGRTTYICYLYNKGVEPPMIAEIVGHTSCKTTLKYYAKMDGKTIFEIFKQKSLGRGKQKPVEKLMLRSFQDQILASANSLTIENPIE